MKTFTRAADEPLQRRRRPGAGSHVPELVDEAFGALIESTQPIVVERSLYSNANGVTWAAGTNATATRAAVTGRQGRSSRLARWTCWWLPLIGPMA